MSSGISGFSVWEGCSHRLDGFEIPALSGSVEGFGERWRHRAELKVPPRLPLSIACEGEELIGLLSLLEVRFLLGGRVPWGWFGNGLRCDGFPVRADLGRHGFPIRPHNGHRVGVGCAFEKVRA